ncbi:MAG: hypothetical protein FJ286_05850 [Planctomycetes bacterium]|nr:hypothetical protein [Planctomycetota bacterium]
MTTQSLVVWGVLASAAVAADARLGPPVTLDGEHPFAPVHSADEWRTRSRLVRARLALAAGLVPMLPRPPVQAVIHGRIDRDGYTIEKVFFESFPGHFVTGNLYRPRGPDSRPRPGALCPHGHWPGGRFLDRDADEIRAELAAGAERFPNAARSILQARCVGLARLGCVVFHYDMVGYGDSIQTVGHRHAATPELDGRDPGTWGLGGFEAAARLQNVYGLQTFNSLRALDFLATLPDVDARRLGVTGASGGGTQTVAAAALDGRLTAAFAAAMISTSMQGGCTCENAPYLRIDQGNIELAALVAPRALGLTAADDWTRDLEHKGYPDLLDLYRMLGVPESFEAHFDIQFGHNFNAVARSHCLRFMSRHLGLGRADAASEADYVFSSREDLTVWGADHPAPAGDDVGAAHERRLCAAWTAAGDAAIGPVLDAADRPAVARAQETLATAYAAIFGRGVPAAGDVAFEPAAADESTAGFAGFDAGIEIERGDAVVAGRGERVACAWLWPADWSGTVLIWPQAGGLADEEAVARHPALAAVLRAGHAVVRADLFGQAECRRDPATDLNHGRDRTEEADSSQESRRQDCSYVYGYNDSAYARRVHDLLTLVAVARNHRRRAAERIVLVGETGAGHWVAGALAAASSTLDGRRDPPIAAAVIDTGGFRFDALPDVWHHDFLPGAVKYADLGGLLAMAAPLPLWIADPDAAFVGRLTQFAALAGGRVEGGSSREHAGPEPPWLPFVDAIAAGRSPAVGTATAPVVGQQ